MKLPIATRENPVIALGGAVFAGILAFFLALALSAFLARNFTQSLNGLMTWFAIGFVCSIAFSILLFVLAINRLNRP
jgi:hypothetical protein